MFDWREYADGIVAFDSGYLRPILAAVHLIVEQGRVAIVDTGSNDSVPNALEALRRLGLDEKSVDFVILTHIHLDHAGGAGRMMSVFQNARLVVHPRGVRHMAEPSRLVAGVSAVYGADYVHRVYGEIVPVPAERIIAAEDGLSLSLAGRSLRCIDTPGHAKHHICIADAKSGGIFTGDMFGLSYRELDVAGRQFLFPTTTPTQFDPLEMRDSINRLVSLRPTMMYLTHYGQLEKPAENAIVLLRHLDRLVAIALACAETGVRRHDVIKQQMTTYLIGEIRAHGCTLPDSQLLELWGTDLELNTQGLTHWLDTQAA